MQEIAKVIDIKIDKKGVFCVKITPPIDLLPYVAFENGKVVPSKPIPKKLQKKFERFCKDFEAINERHKQRFYTIR